MTLPLLKKHGISFAQLALYNQGKLVAVLCCEILGSKLERESDQPTVK